MLGGVVVLLRADPPLATQTPPLLGFRVFPSNAGEASHLLYPAAGFTVEGFLPTPCAAALRLLLSAASAGPNNLGGPGRFAFLGPPGLL